MKRGNLKRSGGAEDKRINKGDRLTFVKGRGWYRKLMK
jgi:hypothetical protein